jgi:molecular chaperone GrpE (heat shock protein)
LFFSIRKSNYAKNKKYKIEILKDFVLQKKITDLMKITDKIKAVNLCRNARFKNIAQAQRKCG